MHILKTPAAGHRRTHHNMQALRALTQAVEKALNCVCARACVSLETPQRVVPIWIITMIFA